MDLFHIIDDATAILRIRGKRYRQTKVFRRGKNIFAAIGNDYVRLLPYGGTTDPTVSWLAVEGPKIVVTANRAPVLG